MSNPDKKPANPLDAMFSDRRILRLDIKPGCDRRRYYFSNGEWYLKVSIESDDNAEQTQPR